MPYGQAMSYDYSAFEYDEHLADLVNEQFSILMDLSMILRKARKAGQLTPSEIQRCLELVEGQTLPEEGRENYGLMDYRESIKEVLAESYGVDFEYEEDEEEDEEEDDESESEDEASEA